MPRRSPALPRAPRLGPEPTGAAARHAGVVRWGLLACLLAAAAGRATAQTVVEVQGGGSSLLGGYGATANVWRQGMDGWVGIGWLDGLRLGAFLRAAVGRDTLRLGNDVLTLR
jgi:hypothetical protein